MNKFTYLEDKEFKKGRRYIGASDVPTIALLNLQYKTPLDLYLEKIGEKDPKFGSERAQMGHELESIILKLGLQKICSINNAGLKKFLVSRVNEEFNYNNFLHSFTEARHQDCNFIVAHADLILELAGYGETILEAKSTGFFGGLRKNDLDKGYDKNDLTANGIPSSVFLQVQTQMLCYSINECYVSALIDTGMHRLYGPIKAEKKIQEKILAICDRFWWHVENKKPPKPETWKDVCYLNPDVNEKDQKIIAGDTEQKIIEMKDRAKKLRAREKEIKKELTDIKNGIGLTVGKNKFLMSSEGHKLATAFMVSKYNAKDLKGLKEKYPDIFDKLFEEGFINISEYKDLRY